MESNIAYLDHVPDWDESDERIFIGTIELKRFTTLHGVITILLSGDDVEVDLETVNIVLLFLPSFSTSRDLLTFLIDRFDVRKLSNSTNSCREQRQLKILNIIQYWLRADVGTCDISGSIIDALSEFIEEVIARGSKPVVSLSSKIRAQMKTIRENLLNADRAQAQFKDRTRHMHTLGQPAFRPLTSDAIGDDSDDADESFSRGSAHSVLFLGRGSRRGSESSLVNVSLGGASDDLVRSEMLIAELGLTDAAAGKVSGHKKSSRSAAAAGEGEAIEAINSSSNTAGTHKQCSSTSTSIVKVLPYDELAEHLTIIEYESHLRSIRLREFVNLGWTQAASKHVHPDIGGSAHLTRVVAYTNQCIAWIAREVVDYARHVGPAAECIEYFVRVARECLKRNNFNTFFQIVAALGLPAVLQLKTAWTNVATTKQTLFRSFLQVSMCSCDDDYANYRALLRSVQGQPFIPCFQILLRDITMMENSGPWIVGGRIDMQKAKMLFDVIVSNIPRLATNQDQPRYVVELSEAVCELPKRHQGKDRFAAAQFEKRLRLKSYVVSNFDLSVVEVDSMLAAASFISECVAMRECLFLSSRPSTQPLFQADPTLEYFPQKMSQHQNNHQHANTAPPAGGVFKRLMRSMRAISFSSVDNNGFTLHGDDSILLLLQIAFNKTSTDLNLLSEDSRLADEAESRRLIGKLTKAGLF